jgi:DNA-binding CsgD family transcriptional regulator
MRSKFEYALTAAEERVLTLVSEAKTNREIASTLGIRPCTVKRHIENILRKLHLRNRVQAAIYGLTLRCCTSPESADCPLKAWRKSSLPNEPPNGDLAGRHVVDRFLHCRGGLES